MSPSYCILQITISDYIRTSPYITSWAISSDPLIWFLFFQVHCWCKLSKLYFCNFQFCPPTFCYEVIIHWTILYSIVLLDHCPWLLSLVPCPSVQHSLYLDHCKASLASIWKQDFKLNFISILEHLHFCVTIPFAGNLWKPWYWPWTLSIYWEKSKKSLPFLKALIQSI